LQDYCNAAFADKGKIGMPSSRFIHAFTALAGLSLLLVLAACAEPRQEERTGFAVESEAARRAGEGEVAVFTRAYEEILGSYIEPVTGADIVLPGIRQLGSIDPDFTAETDGIGLSLRQNGKTVGRIAYPADDDAAQWARLTELALGVARQYSPAIAGAGSAQLLRVVFAGVLSPLDRFTRYSPPEEARRQRALREGSDGIGVALDKVGDEIRIGSLFPGGPAAAAGIRPGDRLVAIDGNSVEGMTLDAVASRLDGAASSPVGLRIIRQGAATALRFDLARTHVIPPTVSVRFENGVGFVRIASFNEDTRDSLAAEIARLQAERKSGLRGLVLDLRSNPGGILEQGVAVAALFLDRGRIAMTTGRSAETDQIYETRSGDMTGGLPLAVLVNGRSASSAEVVAAALQDNGRAVAVGSASFGKGSVQAVVPLPDDGELILTWARLLTPAGYGLNGHGIVPSICTSGLTGDAALDRTGDRKTRPLVLANSRARLDEIGWIKLRAACPPREEEGGADAEIARHLVADRLAWHRALLAKPSSLAAVTP